MIHGVIKIKAEGSADYPRLSTYLWDDSNEIPISKRALVLICPGGRYHRTTDREAKAVTLRLLSITIIPVSRKNAKVGLILQSWLRNL
jgi:hypothetical protein